MDYRQSHQGTGKGIQYHQEFVNKRYRNYLWKREQDFLLDALKLIPLKDKYLDFACGTGRILSFLEDHFQNSYGVDVSTSMLSVARAGVKKSILFQQDITTEPLKVSAFSLITSFRFFLNAEQELRVSAMRELSSMLQENGTLIFNNHMNRWSLHALVIRLYKIIKSDKKNDFRTLSNGEIQAMARQAGLVVHKKYHYGFLPILNENTPIPLGLINALERLFYKAHIFNSFSTCVIYVCKKAENV
jgi:SAM-dependent methyltransferase